MEVRMDLVQGRRLYCWKSRGGDRPNRPYILRYDWITNREHYDREIVGFACLHRVERCVCPKSD